MQGDPEWLEKELRARQGDHSQNGRVEPPQEREINPADVATIEDLIRAGAQVSWLWEKWIPRGVLTAIAAKGGTGKTRFCADILRRVRHQLPWPDESPMTLPPDSLALWVVSDNHHDEMVDLSRSFDIAPNVRINATRADPYGGVTLETLEDYADLSDRIRAVKPTFVIVDTVGNATDKNLSRQEDAKAFYQPLQIMARRYRCGFLCLTHLNSTGEFLGRRVLEKVRVAIKMAQFGDEEKRRLEVPKSFSKRPDALGLMMGDQGNEYDNDPPQPPIAEPGQSTPSKTSKAVAWLRKELAGAQMRVCHLIDKAKAEGISMGILYDAKKILKVEESGTQGNKWWALTSNADLPD